MAAVAAVEVAAIGSMLEVERWRNNGACKNVTGLKQHFSTKVQTAI